jgi:hypothetical protein
MTVIHPFKGVNPINIPRQTPAAISLGETLASSILIILAGKEINGII